MTDAALKIEEAKPLKLDFGCGKNTREGFTGVDSRDFGQAITHDLTKPWPWEDESVEEAHSSHFVEHLDWPERIHFFNELYRVLKKGAKATIITPHWSHACFYGDPTHKAPLSEWYVNYLNKAWRDVNAPHVDYTCDFDFVTGGSPDMRLTVRNQEFQQFASANYVNAVRDLYVTLTKK